MEIDKSEQGHHFFAPILLNVLSLSRGALTQRASRVEAADLEHAADSEKFIL